MSTNNVEQVQCVIDAFMRAGPAISNCIEKLIASKDLDRNGPTMQAWNGLVRSVDELKSESSAK